VQFAQLTGNIPFVSDYNIIGDSFVGFVTTKNLLLNLVKQAMHSCSNLSIDGTWSLKFQGYPTIVVGTRDLSRRFHLGNIITFETFNFY